MPYIGRPLNAGNLAVQSGTGDGSDTTPIATLDYSVGSSNSIGVYLDGVRQLAGTDFTASGTVLTFTTAPANLVGIDVYFLGLELSIPTPGDATVTAAKLASNAVTTAKIIANAVDETKLKDALVADFTEVVVTASDSILLGDATDSGNTKRDTVQGVLDLVPAGQTAKVWINWNGSGNGATESILDSFNVTSMADTGTGLNTLTFDTDFANDDYAFVMTSHTGGGTNDATLTMASSLSSATTGDLDVFTLVAVNSATTFTQPFDVAVLSIVIFGDQ